MTRDRPATPSDPGTGAFALVVDASALLSGVPLPADRRLVVPSAVLAEVGKRGRDNRALQYRLETGLEVRDPTPEARTRVQDAATSTGDHHRLSDPDRDVVALALDMKGGVLSDDYSIQNVATVLGVPITPIAQRGITEVRRWTLRCIGCRKTFDREVPDCDVCGSPVKTVRDRSGGPPGRKK